MYCIINKLQLYLRLKWWSSVQVLNILSSSLLSKNINTNIRTVIILPVLQE